MLRSFMMLSLALFATALFAAAPTAKSPSVKHASDTTSHEGTVVSAASGKLTMTGADGKEHSHMIPATCKFTLEGKSGKLEDLKKGDKITVTTDNTGKVLGVTRGAATPAKPAAKAVTIHAPTAPIRASK